MTDLTNLTDLTDLLEIKYTLEFDTNCSSLCSSIFLLLLCSLLIVLKTDELLNNVLEDTLLDFGIKSSATLSETTKEALDDSDNSFTFDEEPEQVYYAMLTLFKSPNIEDILNNIYRATSLMKMKDRDRGSLLEATSPNH